MVALWEQINGCPMEQINGCPMEQINGCPMGNPLSVVLANIYMVKIGEIHN